MSWSVHFVLCYDTSVSSFIVKSDKCLGQFILCCVIITHQCQVLLWRVTSVLVSSFCIVLLWHISVKFYCEEWQVSWSVHFLLCYYDTSVSSFIVKSDKCLGQFILYCVIITHQCQVLLWRVTSVLVSSFCIVLLWHISVKFYCEEWQVSWSVHFLLCYYNTSVSSFIVKSDKCLGQFIFCCVIITHQCQVLLWRVTSVLVSSFCVVLL